MVAPDGMRGMAVSCTADDVSRAIGVGRGRLAVQRSSPNPTTRPVQIVGASTAGRRPGGSRGAGARAVGARFARRGASPACRTRTTTTSCSALAARASEHAHGPGHGGRQVAPMDRRSCRSSGKPIRPDSPFAPRRSTSNCCRDWRPTPIPIPPAGKLFHRLYAWFDKGNYLFRAGQLLRRQLVIVPEAMPADEAAREAAWWSQPPLPQAPAGISVHDRRSRPAAVRSPARRLGRLRTHVRRQFRAISRQSPRESHVRLDALRRLVRRARAQLRQQRIRRGLGLGRSVDADRPPRLFRLRTGDGAALQFDRHPARRLHASDLDGIVWEHSFNHVGTSLPPEQLQMPLDDPGDRVLPRQYGKSMFRGEIDPKGHIFQEGNWLYAAMTRRSVSVGRGRAGVRQPGART